MGSVTNAIRSLRICHFADAKTEADLVTYF